MILLSGFRAWRERRSAMREIEIIKSEEEDRLVRSPASPLEKAVLAVDSGDAEQASELWEQARALTPRHIMASHHTVHVLIKLERLDELEALMLTGHRRSRTDPLFLSGLARLAERRGKTDDALRWWSKLRKCRPTRADGWIEGAACLRRLGRHQEAAAVLTASTRYMDADYGCHAELAYVRETLSDWRGALEEWDYIAGPMDRPTGHCGAARVYEKLGDLPAARLRLATGRLKHPYDADLIIASARLEERSGNLDLASRRWAELRLSRPKSDLGYSEGIRILNLAEKPEAARLLRQEAAERFPENPIYFSPTAVEHSVALNTEGHKSE